MRKFFIDILSEDDGVHYSGAKVVAYVTILCYLINATWAIHQSHPDDFAAQVASLGSGLGYVLAGCGALITGTQFSMKSFKKED
jgi:cyanate permease